MPIEFLSFHGSLGTIEKMTKSKIARMFQLKKSNGKGLDKVKAGRKEKEAREELRTKGLDSIDVQGMQKQDGAVSSVELRLTDNDDNVSEARRGLFGKKNKETQVIKARDIKGDYEGYSEGIANVLKQQDDDLDQIGDVLSDMQVMAKAMNNELEYQDKLLHEVQDFTNETSRRAKDNARKIGKLK